MSKPDHQLFQPPIRQMVFVVMGASVEEPQVEVRQRLGQDREQRKPVMRFDETQTVPGGKVAYTARFQHTVDLAHQRRRIGDMFINVHANHDVEGSIRKREVLGVHDIVIYITGAIVVRRMSYGSSIDVDGRYMPQACGVMYGAISSGAADVEGIKAAQIMQMVLENREGFHGLLPSQRGI